MKVYVITAVYPELGGQPQRMLVYSDGSKKDVEAAATKAGWRVSKIKEGSMNDVADYGEYADVLREVKNKIVIRRESARVAAVANAVREGKELLNQQARVAQSVRRKEDQIALAAWHQKEQLAAAARQAQEDKLNAEAPIRCPKCGSTQVAATKKGFGLGKAAVGAVLLGPAGLLGGLVGSGKVTVTCLKCGKTFDPGHGK
jgi:pyruvate dehydrogenase complex dehydrogenase (E1) component